MTTLLPAIEAVTEQIRKRSTATRRQYLQATDAAAEKSAEDRYNRATLSCTNIAHAVAASPSEDKLSLQVLRSPNLGIVTSYNDMLSAHQPYAAYPDIIRKAVRAVGATAQVAGATPAMCDGVTQGQPGMGLSLFSRDVIAMSTAIALSHNMFDAAVYLGVCDKIVPGLLMGALAYGHLPGIFIPAGPMTSGIPNSQKAAVRQRHAAGKASREELLASELESYHGPGTCTFYGTANSNQMLLEIMGLHLPGAAFINPGEPLREALTVSAAQRAIALAANGDAYTPLGRLVDERVIVNGIVGLMATGGSTNHTLHLVAIARAAGIIINWDDFGKLSQIVPLLARVYPNGKADVNQFHAAGGIALVIRELLSGGFLHEDVMTVAGQGLSLYTQEPVLQEDESSPSRLQWRDGVEQSLSEDIIRPCKNPWSSHGGLQVLHGNLGRAVIKTSALSDDQLVVEAEALIFDSQEALLEAFKAGDLERDFVAVVRFQGPRANGMPELHKLTPALGVLQDKGFKVALVTDGRMSGASGKIPAAIHVCPECRSGGELGRLRNGDIVRIDAHTGELLARVDSAVWQQRELQTGEHPFQPKANGLDLFSSIQQQVSDAECGASLVSWCQANS